jgi:hypothetical protein
MEFSLKKTLEWCEANGVVFKVSIEAGLLAIAGRNGNIFAEYTIDETCTPEAVGQAVYAALYSVKQGSEFHAKHGHFPPVSPSTGPPEVGDGKGSYTIPELPSNAPQNLRLNPES